MKNGRSYEVTPIDVTTIMGIPSSSSIITVHNGRATSRRLYNLSNLGDNIAITEMGFGGLI